MDLKMLHDLKDIICMELGILVDKAKKHDYQMAPNDLDTYKKLTAVLESVTVIEAAEGGETSQDGGWEARGQYDRSMAPGRSYGDGGYSYDDGRYARRSYANRGQHYVRAHYSRADEMEHLKELLQEIMESDGLDDRQRKALRQAMEAMNK